VSPPTLSVNGVEPPRLGIDAFRPTIPCVKGGLVALCAEGPATLCAKGPATLCVKKECPTCGVEEGTVLFQVGLYERNCVSILKNDGKLTSIAIASENLDGFF
jgi:hypothetical protein